MRVPTTRLCASSDTTTCTTPAMPCCCAIAGVSGETVRSVVAATFGRRHDNGVGVDFGVAVGVAAGGAGVAATSPAPGGGVPGRAAAPFTSPVTLGVGGSVRPPLRAVVRGG